MRIIFFLLLFISFGSFAYAQDDKDSIPAVVDSLYREDQFYVGLTFHLLSDLPETVSQSSFSGGLHLGFIRDFPINKRRNVAIGAGLGWSINTYGQELFIGEDDAGNTIFRNLRDPEVDYDTNRFTTQLIEAPLEFRWRSSTADSYKFWRVYTGLRLGYVYHFKSVFKQPGNKVTQTELPELDRFRIGTTFTFGYNTFNFHIYYSLNPFFKDATLNDSEIGITTFKVGLMFYIL
ncbi:PorT family protein [Gillisia sp. M10.2A]|uniref:PorT family protein n=1 Tax=Gillisia lutea TaxID=2909668 RepID=A0ABS9EDG3_9FLAO|nr:porin family protein [Gillisia lutea]MCF4100297.1 PorT family protein [Gillisia lutea]